MAEKTLKKVCSCVNCGNEAEMVVTCTLEEVESSPAPGTKVKGHGVCTTCGNEADMWIDADELSGV